MQPRPRLDIQKAKMLGVCLKQNLGTFREKINSNPQAAMDGKKGTFWQLSKGDPTTEEDCTPNKHSIVQRPGKKGQPFLGEDHFEWGRQKKGKRVPLNN